MNPVPGHDVSTPYGARGAHWSCDRDAHGQGIHTGVDFAAPAGTPVYAARPGQLVWCDHGSAFGAHQVEVRCGDGTRDFYAHLRTRAAQGPVEAGALVGSVGAEGNATGPHLHFERHATETGGWSCAIVRDPQPSIDYQEEDAMTPEDWDKLRRIVADEVAANNNDLAERVWTDNMTVTSPAGDDQRKSARQVLREVWQRVAKAT